MGPIKILRKRGHSETRLEDLEAELAYTLGGRAAERLVLSSLSAGAGGTADSDLAIATRLAVHIDSRYGLGAWGPIYLDAPDGALLHDPATRQRVRNRIEKAERQATAILRENSDLLERMAGGTRRRAAPERQFHRRLAPASPGCQCRP
ncbi:hypothetical protein OEZ60_13225 [Defluviimonas sp. WL0024]|uniref:Peptidase M41 domain-containing protein n=1 Tax=Albidovulum salinarum TaxID=2984153 RepID=A0ABT2X4V9_9RHOB|nr:hypothetical protein [Defluviimonas sp. WL0024]MCU9848966.1 hypothetical protein [Defluviimonas sp. WL0024]